MGSFLAALGLVFVAELGDKTQLVAMGLGARHRLAPVLAGVVVAYAATNLVSVVIGGLVGAAIPSRAINIFGGVAFLGFAAWSLRADNGDEGEIAPLSTGGVVASVAVAMFVAELGDKTMLATSALAARGDVIATWAGATVGITASGLVGVLLGRALGTRLPARVTKVASAVLFTLFGIALLVSAW